MCCFQLYSRFPVAESQVASLSSPVTSLTFRLTATFLGFSMRTMATAPTKDKMQPQDRPVETSVLEFKKPLAVDEEGNPIRVDYAGAHAKIDPAEIKLVRKLDLWIIPTLWLMYWLNFLDRNAIALARSVAFLAPNLIQICSSKILIQTQYP